AGRSERRRRQHEARAAEQAPAWFVEHQTALPDAESVTAALQALPLEQREIIVAHLWGGLTFQEIGTVAGLSSSTAHRWYLAGLSALRERLGVSCPSPRRPMPS